MKMGVVVVIFIMTVFVLCSMSFAAHTTTLERRLWRWSGRLIFTFTVLLLFVIQFLTEI